MIPPELILSEQDYSKPHSPELGLWNAVILIAIRDARNGEHNAIRWLTSDEHIDTVDRNMVCEFAGVNGDQLRRLSIGKLGLLN